MKLGREALYAGCETVHKKLDAPTIDLLLGSGSPKISLLAMSQAAKIICRSRSL